MKFTEYYHSALRHLETCQLMLEKLSTIGNDKPLLATKQRLKLDIYYLSGYIVETMLSYAFFANIKWNKNVDIKKCSLYTKDFKTHKLESKLFFVCSRGKCDFSGIKLIGVKPENKIEKRMFHEWSEVVRYQNPKTCSQLEFTEHELKCYLNDIKVMFKQIRNKFYV